MAASLADRQVRNRGTIGGNCCLNDPASNFPPLFVALDAVFVVVGPSGERRLDAGEFFAGTLRTALAPGELLAVVEIPPAAAGSRVEHCQLQVFADLWAVARAVVRLDVDGSTVRDARVVVGAVLSSPHCLEGVEEAFVGRLVGPGLADAVEWRSTMPMWRPSVTPIARRTIGGACARSCCGARSPLLPEAAPHDRRPGCASEVKATGSVSPRRADTRRNHVRILAAAAESLATSDEVSFNTIAKKADVGVGTVYRHFPHPRSAHPGGLPARGATSRRRRAGPARDAHLETGFPDVDDRSPCALHDDQARPGQRAARRNALPWGTAPYVYEALVGAVATLLKAKVEAGTVRADLHPETVLRGLGGLLYLDRSGGWKAQTA